jgi:hypothetical protein
MLIILTLYIIVVWLIFSKLKLVKWGWGSGTATVLVGAFILAVFLAMFNYLTPSGSFIIGSQLQNSWLRVTGNRGDAERVRPGHRNPGQAERAGKSRDRPVPDRSSALPVQG